MPTRQAYVFNLSRGPFGSGRYGYLAQELDDVGLDDRGRPRTPGAYYPVALHRSQPRCPVPGRAIGVVGGVLPGTVAAGRVGFFVQGRHTGGPYRSAVMVSARSGAATPLGGTLDDASDVYVEVTDDVVYAWPRARSRGALNAAAAVAAALETFRRLGLADV